MTRTQAIDLIKAKLKELDDEQLKMLADLAESYARPMTEDDATRAAIAEGVAQSKAGVRVTALEVDELLTKPWR